MPAARDAAAVATETGVAVPSRAAAMADRQVRIEIAMLWLKLPNSHARMETNVGRRVTGAGTTDVAAVILARATVSVRTVTSVSSVYSRIRRASERRFQSVSVQSSSCRKGRDVRSVVTGRKGPEDVTSSAAVTTASQENRAKVARIASRWSSVAIVNAEAVTAETVVKVRSDVRTSRATVLHRLPKRKSSAKPESI